MLAPFSNIFSRSALLELEARFFLAPPARAGISQDNRALNRPISAYSSLICFLCSASRARSSFAIILEKLDEVFQSLLFPFVDLVRMNAVFDSDLCHAFVFSEGFQDDLGFLASG